MLQSLDLKDVGPAPELHFHFGPRINILTGDNGVGKSFVLDVAWWALTQTWAGYPASPRRGPGAAPQIDISYQTQAGNPQQTHEFDFRSQLWPAKHVREIYPGLVLYARADGGFSVWDPARNRWRNAPRGHALPSFRREAYHFESKQVWEGLREEERQLCNGLIADWVSWQREGGTAFDQLASVLDVLAPSESEPLRSGKPMRISLEDSRDMPTLEMPYGTVPLVHASAGMRRIAALAYLLVWTWREHQTVSELLNQSTTNEITFLIDEIEAHLHPRWQRAILPALLRVMTTMTRTDSIHVQTIAATHAPLLLASIEPIFDEEQDRVFSFELDGRNVSLNEVPWAKQGDAVGWLVSDVFGLKQARSREAEQAIEAAEALMRGDATALPPDLRTREQIHSALQRVLPGHDAFWPRWIVTSENTEARRR